MGVIKNITPATLSAAHSAASGTKGNISVNLIHREKVKSSYKNQTSKEGPLLGVARPVWLKVTESEQRLSWLDKMVKKGLCVKEIESYARSQHEKLRSDELKIKEEERVVLMGLMRVKLKDEKRNLEHLRIEREELRRRIKLLRK